jgi:hypothetical protein
MLLKLLKLSRLFPSRGYGIVEVVGLKGRAVEE